MAEFIRRRQGKCGPYVGMSGKGNLPGGREDANPTCVSRFRGEHECALGEIELSGNPLHLLFRKPIGLGKHRKLIAAEAGVGKNVADVVTIAHNLWWFIVSPWNAGLNTRFSGASPLTIH